VKLPAIADLKKDGGLMAVSASMMLFGYLMRRQNLGFPPHENWDEEHFVRNARAYLSGGLDLNDHPPLGKLLIAAGMKLAGDNPFGWRIVPMIFGVIAIPLAFGLAAKLFEDWKAGVIAASLVAADGFFIAYSRSALLDGMLAVVMMGAALLIVRATRPWEIFSACVLIGLACSIKFSGVTLIPAVLVVTLVLRRTPRWTALCLLVSVLVYFACFSIGLRWLHMPGTPLAVFRATRGLWGHHIVLTDMTHPATSYWYTWFLPVRPILLNFHLSRAGWVRALTTMGNPLLWWAGSAALCVSLLSLLRAWLAARAGREVSLHPFLVQHRRAVWILLGLWALPLLPWVITRRDSYIYHYLPCYAFALILVAGMIAWLYRQRAVYGLVALMAIGEVSVYYAPVWGDLPLSQDAYEQRLFRKSWR
jgi:dolichyl-phosphate-mannose-protein mannosyltransferase